MKEAQEAKPFRHIDVFHYILNFIHSACTDLELHRFTDTNMTKTDSMLEKINEFINKNDEDAEIISRLAPISNVIAVLKKLITSKTFNSTYLVNDEKIDSAIIYLILNQQSTAFKNLIITVILNFLKSQVASIEEGPLQKAVLDEIIYLTDEATLIKTIKQICENKTEIVEGIYTDVAEILNAKINGTAVDPYLDKIFINSVSSKFTENAQQSDIIKYFS